MMRILRLVLPLSAALLASSHGSAAESKSNATGTLSRVTKEQAAWAAEARKSYPLEVCVVSGEKLGSMGKPPEYVYRVEGQLDRLVVFCCSGCDEDFQSEPAKHLAKIDAAAAEKAKSAKKN